MAWDQLVAVADALDGQLGLDFHWRGADLDRLVDADHATIAAALAGLYRAAEWEVVVEATFSEFGERGSIDVLAWHRATGAVAVNEVKASIGDAGGTLAGVDRKARLAPIIARKLGWTCNSVSRFLVVAEGSTARRRIAAHADMFRSAFPLGGRECQAWIRRPTRRAVGGLLFLSPGPREGNTRSSSRARRVRTGGPRTNRPIAKHGPLPDDSGEDT